MERLLSEFFLGSLTLFDTQVGAISDKEMYDVLVLCKKLISVPLRNYFQFLNKDDAIDETLSPSDIIQFSNFKDATNNLCKTLILAGNSGFAFEEVGAFLLRKVDSKNTKGSNTKYGENHLKAGMILGLTNKNNNKWYLTKIGCIFNELTIDEQTKLISRLVLKSKFIKTIIYDAMRKDVWIDDYTACLSESTRIRRNPNIKALFLCLKNNGEFNIDNIFDAINGGELL